MAVCTICSNGLVVWIFRKSHIFVASHFRPVVMILVVLKKTVPLACTSTIVGSFQMGMISNDRRDLMRSLANATYFVCSLELYNDYSD